MRRLLSFSERILKAAEKHSSRLIVALDLEKDASSKLLNSTLNLIDKVSEYVAGVKLNYHLLLPLDLQSSVRKIVDKAHDSGLQVLADLKLNDIESTNIAAGSYLWDAGFDAVTANPFVGYEEGLKGIFNQAHQDGRGVILLTYMSHRGVKEGYGLLVKEEGSQKLKPIFEIFVERALMWGADGVIIGATSPDIISKVSSKSKGKMLIFCPGVGAQGGDPGTTLKSGADFLIIGRTIIRAPDPSSAAAKIRQETQRLWRT